MRIGTHNSPLSRSPHAIKSKPYKSPHNGIKYNSLRTYISVLVKLVTTFVIYHVEHA